MTRFKLVSLLCLIAASALGVLAQPAPRAVPEITLISPAHLSTVMASAVTFEWQESAGTNYKFTLRSVDGLQYFTQTFGNSCLSSVCAYGFDAAANGWAWRENVIYKWSVKAKDGSGTVVAASPKAKFITDMLPEIELLGPPHQDIESLDGLVDFAWSIDARTQDSRIRVKDAAGVIVFTSPWLPPASYCGPDACSYVVDFNALADGPYKWWIEMRGVNVAKIKSVKRVFVLDLG